MVSLKSPNRLYIAGTVGGSSIAPPAHEFISDKLGMGWKMEFLRKKTPEEVMEVFRSPDFAGGVVTMPHKKTIVPFLDEVDDLVYSIGACNIVYRCPSGRLLGTNTDWRGIVDALRTASSNLNGGCAMVYGAGGASRAAVYALAAKMGYHDIYVVNRDDGEVADLEEDLELYGGPVYQFTHVKTAQQARELPAPTCIVGTVPDIEPKFDSELEATKILAEFLSREGTEKGVLLDMCYFPRTTRNIRLALSHGWKIVEGIEVVAHQLKTQWKLWTGLELSAQYEREAMDVLFQFADADPSVTPAVAQIY